MRVLWSASHAIVIRFVYFHAVTIADTLTIYERKKKTLHGNKLACMLQLKAQPVACSNVMNS